MGPSNAFTTEDVEHATIRQGISSALPGCFITFAPRGETLWVATSSENAFRGADESAERLAPKSERSVY